MSSDSEIIASAVIAVAFIMGSFLSNFSAKEGVSSDCATPFVIRKAGGRKFNSSNKPTIPFYAQKNYNN